MSAGAEAQSPRPATRSLLWIAGAAIVLFGLYEGVRAGIRLYVDSRIEQNRGQMLPAFEFEDRDGRTWSPARLRGQEVVLNFFRSRCSSCVAERDAIRRLAAALGPDQVLLGVMTDRVNGFPREETRRTLERFGYRHPILMADEELMDAFHGVAWSHVTPVTYIVDDEGGSGRRCAATRNTRTCARPSTPSTEGGRGAGRRVVDSPASRAARLPPNLPCRGAVRCRPPVRSLLPLLLLALLPCTGCGAGIVTGIVSQGGENRTPPPVQVPRISFPAGTVPLRPQLLTGLRDVIVENRTIPSGSNLRVEIRAAGEVAVQNTPIIVTPTATGQPGPKPGSTQIKFALFVDPIANAIGDLTARDVPGEIAVLVDGAEVAEPAPILLLRQPLAEVVLPPGIQRLELSPAGTSRVTVRLSQMRASGVDDLRMLVAPVVSEQQIRECTNLAISNLPGTEDFLLSGDVPGNAYPVRAFLGVQSTVSGLSTLIDTAYVPRIDRVMPPVGAVGGGGLVALRGLALVPAIPESDPPEPDFDRVSVLFRKGNREKALPDVALRRDLSTVDQLVFPLLPSMDGRPGDLRIIVRADLGFATTVEATADGLFRYGFADPVFGPRGAVLGTFPDDTTAAALVVPGSGTPDLGVLRTTAGFPELEVRRGEGTGMYQPFLKGIRPADPTDPAMLGPRSLGAGDFDGDGDRDLVTVLAGSGAMARHLVIPGLPPPDPVLGPGRVAFTSPAARERVHVADLDVDGLPDLVVGAEDGAGDRRPRSYLALAGSPGAPRFSPVGVVPLTGTAWDIETVGEVDGDGLPDLVVARGGASPAVAVLTGDGTGSFVLAQELSLSGAIPGYRDDAASPAVGIHAVGGSGVRSLALVLAGLPADPATPPTVARLEPDPQAPGSAWLPPSTAGTTNLGGGVLGHSAAADLDGDDVEELVVGRTGTPSSPLELLALQGAGYAVQAGAVDAGGEVVREIREMYFATGLAAATPIRPAPVPGLHVVHEAEVDGAPEVRLSVFPAGSGASLQPAAGGWHEPDPVRGVATTRFSMAAAEGLGSDLVLAVRDELRVYGNDTRGGWRPESVVSLPGLVPSSVVGARELPPLVGVLALVDGAALELVRVTTDGSASHGSGDLRGLLPSHLQGAAVAGGSRLEVADLDGDGAGDVVVLLRFAGLGDPGEGDGVLLVFRGGASGPFPFTPPVAVTAVHGRSWGMASGDLAPGSGELEVAVSVPRGSTAAPISGSHVRFYRLEDPAAPELRLIRSRRPGGAGVLVAGSEPWGIGVTDVDGNGTADLVVGSGVDDRMHVLLNDGRVTGGGEVDPDAFVPSHRSPFPLPPGAPRALELQDINGDGRADAVLVVTEDGPPMSHAVAVYLADGAAGYDGPWTVPATRTGSTVQGAPRDAPVAFLLGGLSGDPFPDLLFGWDTAGGADTNVRVLFGGAR